MTETIEREVKLSFESPDAARNAVARIDARLVRARRLQDDHLLDTPDHQLRAARCTLRVRVEAADDGRPAGTVTFKGRPRPDVMKVREEVETGVDDAHRMLDIFRRTGWHVWFRYQKYREEYDAAGVVVAVDETPCGVFVEIEGDRAGIERTARALGRTPRDYIVASYRTLHEAHCAGAGRPVGDMVFD